MSEQVPVYEEKDIKALKGGTPDFCRAANHDIKRETPVVSGRWAVVECQCGTCGQHWAETYILTHMTEWSAWQALGRKLLRQDQT